MKYLQFIVIVTLVVGVLSTKQFVFAHEGVTHATEVESTLHTEQTEEQMRTIIALLQKLIFLLQSKRDAQYVVPTDSVTTSVPTQGAHDDEMEEHHEMHAVEEKSVEDTVLAKKLIIEVEEHNNATHVHVRYVDKPEEMFFVTAPLSDENSVVRMTAERTGISEADVRAALVHTGM